LSGGIFAYQISQFWKALELKLLVYFLTFWYYYDHAVYSLAIWFILMLFGTFSYVVCIQEKMAFFLKKPML
jgi:hypothetical protein